MHLAFPGRPVRTAQRKGDEESEDVCGEQQTNGHQIGSGIQRAKPA
ncbi:MAG: hypothetical protein U5J83_12890 [Bryobacterales bacterium]|nr:hypothetical protein [Bryobacterales bacterium]